MKNDIQNSPWVTMVEATVQFYDLDPMEIVWHGNYPRFLELARCALLEQIGYSYTEMKKSGYIWPVIDMRFRYISPARFGQRLKIRAELVEWENRLKIDYLITDAVTGKRINRATTVQVAVNAITHEMSFVSPSVLLSKLGLPTL